jgi:hypothetical protein
MIVDVGSVSEYKTLRGNMNTHAGFAWWWLPTFKLKKPLLIKLIQKRFFFA